MRILQVILGLILLLPGICNLGFIFLFVSQLSSADWQMALPIWFFGFFISAFGVLLIVRAVTHP